MIQTPFPLQRQLLHSPLSPSTGLTLLSGPLLGHSSGWASGPLRSTWIFYPNITVPPLHPSLLYLGPCSNENSSGRSFPTILPQRVEPPLFSFTLLYFSTYHLKLWYILMCLLLFSICLTQLECVLHGVRPFFFFLPCALLYPLGLDYVWQINESLINSCWRLKYVQIKALKIIGQTEVFEAPNEA